MIIFCDGVFDLFHFGHVNHFKQIKDLYPDSFLIVGILNDELSTNYKRKPFLNELKRKKLIESCKYVDKTIFDYPIIMTEQFIDENNIDLIVHAFNNKHDHDKQQKYFEIPIKLNKFKILNYDNNISTTSILNNINTISNIDTNDKSGWDLIWEKKGNTKDDNPFNLNGYDDTSFNPKDSFNDITSKFNISKDSKVLEFGCGAGLLSNIFNNECDYYGIDYSSSLISKNMKLYNSKVYNCSADKTPFKDKFFDYSFSIGVFEYFPSKEYSLEVINEMKRVTKKGIYIINIRKNTHDCKKEKHKFNGVYKHLIYNTDDFFDFEILVSNYEQNDRFSAIKYLT
jgi:cytidyltransferase-like protein